MQLIFREAKTSVICYTLGFQFKKYDKNTINIVNLFWTQEEPDVLGWNGSYIVWDEAWRCVLIT